MADRDEIPTPDQVDSAILNSFNVNIALLDQSGRIISVNEAWRRFGEQNEASEETQRGVGLNYLAICQTASGENSQEARAAQKGIQSILNGSQNLFTLEYPCHSPDQKRWFLLTVSPLVTDRNFAVILNLDITERKLLENALGERGARLQLMLDQIPAVLWSTDRELRFTSLSGSGLREAWVDPQPRIGRTIGQVYSETEDLPVMLAAHEQALRGQSVNYEALIYGHYYQAFVQPFLDMNGDIQGCLGGALDITDRKHAEFEIQKQVARLQVLSDASRAFAEASLEFEAVVATLNAIARRTAELIGDTCVITLLSADDRLLTPVAFSNRDLETQDALQNKVLAAPYQVDQGIADSVVQTGQPVLIQHIPQEQIRSTFNHNSMPFLDHSGVHSLLIVPLLIAKKVIGTLGLSRDTQGRSYTSHDQLFLQDLADRASLAVQNARLFEEAQNRKDKLAILHTNLNRSNTLIAVLSLVAAQIQNSLDPSQIWEIMGAELNKLDVIFFISLLEPENRVLVGSYSSIEPQMRSKAEKILGLAYRDLRISLDQFPGFSALMERGNGFFVEDALEWGHFYFPGFARAAFQQGFQIFGFPPNIKAIILPLIVDQRLIGVMSVIGGKLEESNVPSFSVFSGQVAAALENARLYEMSKTHEEQLRVLTARLAEMEELERRKLAHELHDQVGQTLTALGINLNVVRTLIPSENNIKPLRLIDDSLDLIEEAVERTRDIMAELRPPVLDDYGLLAALKWYADRFAQRTNLDILVEGDEALPEMPVHVESALFRISQEVLVNVVKHAQAQKIHLFLGHEGNLIHLTIEDDGIGFDPAQIHQPERKPTWGLLSIHERAEAIGGHVLIQSSPGQGTKITIEVGI